MKIARFVLLILLAVALLAVADLGYNFFCACAALATESAPVHGLLARLIFWGGEGSMRGFFLAFTISGGVTLALGLANIVLTCIDLLRPQTILF